MAAASEEDEQFFSLLANISLSGETTLERLSSSLKVFVKKYFDNQDFTPPSNPLEIVMNCIMKSEAILYTIYDLEEKAQTEDQRLELLYYKDVVLKTLVVITNLDFFVSELKEYELYKDSYLLREKVKMEFKIEAAKANFSPDSEDMSKLDLKYYRDEKPVDHRLSKEEPKTSLKPNDGYTTNFIPDTFDNNENTNTISKSKKSGVELVLDLDLDEAKPFSAMERLKKAILEHARKKEDENKNQEPVKVEKPIRKMRTAMGWQISPDFFDKGIYADN